MFVNNLRDVIVILSRTTLVGMEDELERINEPIGTDGLILVEFEYPNVYLFYNRL